MIVKSSFLMVAYFNWASLKDLLAEYMAWNYLPFFCPKNTSIEKSNASHISSKGFSQRLEDNVCQIVRVYSSLEVTKRFSSFGKVPYEPPIETGKTLNASYFFDICWRW